MLHTLLGGHVIKLERDRMDKIIKKAGKEMGEWWSPSVVDSVYQCRLQSKLFYTE